MNKACPVVLRIKQNKLELLAFKRPGAGNQLVKGNIKKGESLESACVRELEEESGIKARVVRPLGIWAPGFKKQVWGLCLMHYDGAMSDAWAYETKDDGGQIFNFFWQPLDSLPNDSWDKVYKKAFRYIKDAISQ